MSDGASPGYVQTVLGRIPPEDLGITLLQAIGRRFTRWSPRAMTEDIVAEMLGR